MATSALYNQVYVVASSECVWCVSVCVCGVVCACTILDLGV